MASKTSQGSELSVKELEELLDGVDQTMERLKTLYEQYFLGIQKQAPAFIHNDVERKLRDLQQMQMRNTSLRYRLATLQQKFGAYNSYWRRTLRQIENGTYVRNLAKIGRDAIAKGAEIPEEILAKMPKRMREQVVRDRDAAIAIAKRRHQTDVDEAPMFPPDADDVAAVINEPSVLRRELKTQSGAHVLADDDGDMDFDSFFAAFNDDDAPKPAKPAKPDSQEITRPVAKAPPVADLPPGMAMRNPATPTAAQTVAMPRIPAQSQTGPVPLASATSAIPKNPEQTQPILPPPPGQTSTLPRVPPERQTGPVPAIPPPPGASQAIPRPPSFAPSQAARPNPIAPGSSAQAGPTPVQSMNGPFARPPQTPPASPPITQAVPRVPPAPPARPTPGPGTPPPRPGTAPPRPAAPMKPPPGMTEADVNALHAKYVQAKQAVGEKVDASSREKLLRTINQTAPKIMEQYKASGVDFTVVVKDNQVVIKAKPKG